MPRTGSWKFAVFIQPGLWIRIDFYPNPAFSLNPDTANCKFATFYPSKIVSTKFRSFNAIFGWNRGNFKEKFSARFKRNIGVRRYLATLTVWWETLITLFLCFHWIRIKKSTESGSTTLHTTIIICINLLNYQNCLLARVVLLFYNCILHGAEH
jgi:hypothetical protein